MLYRRGEIYWLRFSHSGQRVSISTGRRDHASAQVEARRLRYEYERRHGRGGRPQGVPLAALEQLDMERVETGGLGPRQGETVRNHWRHLCAVLTPDLDASTLTVSHVDAYEGARRKEGARGQTIRREVQALVRGLRLAKRAALLPSLPIDPDDLRTIRTDPQLATQAGKTWSIVEINQVIGALSAKARAAHYPELLRLVAGTGLRREELRRVDPSWLRPGHGDAAAILELPATATKGRHRREVPLTEEMAATIRALCPLSPSWRPSHALRLACVALGLPRVLTLRDLRKWFLSQVATSDVLAAQRLAGHASVTTTGIYVESDRDRAISAGARVLRLVTVSGDNKKAGEKAQ